MKIPDMYSEIPRLSPSLLRTVSERFGIEHVCDFTPHGRKGKNSAPWKRISSAVLVRDSYACRVCGKSSLSDLSTAKGTRQMHFAVQVHHIAPRKDGGSDSFENLITLCEECHRRTFKDNYSGVPGTRITLSTFGEMVSVAVPQDSLQSMKVDCNCRLLDYGRYFDTELNEYSVRERIGSSIDLSVIKMKMSAFQDIAKVLEVEYGATGYVTMNVSCKEMLVKIFIDDLGNLLL